jgi:autotransporter translocation and assembly factor TamB
MKSLLKIIRLSFAAFRAVCLFILLVGIAIQFPSIQNFCINTFILQKHQKIKIEGFSGLFPFYFSFNKIGLYDHDRPLLIIKNIDIDWSAWDFITNEKIAIKRLEIAHIEYHENIPTNTDKAKITLPKIPLGYISNLKISTAIYKTQNQTFKYSAFGNTVCENNGFEFNLILKNLKEQSEVLNTRIKYANKSGKDGALNLSVIAKEKQGLLNYLAPTIKGEINISLNGAGTFDNFQGKLSAKLGEINILSTISTHKDRDNKSINIVSSHQYQTKNKTYNLSGLIKTDLAFNRFILNDHVLTENNQPYMKVSGEIQQKGEFFESKKLSIQTFISPEYTILTAANFSYSPYRFIINGKLQNDVLLNTQKIASFDIPISAKGTLESLKIRLSGSGTIPNLPAPYKKYSQFNLEAELESKSILNVPKIKLEFIGPAGKINGGFLIGRDFNFNLQGNLLSNSFQINSYWKDGNLHISGKHKAPENQPWTISEITTTIKNLAFEGNAQLKITNKHIDVQFTGDIDQDFQNFNIASLRAHHQESFLESKGYVNLLKEEGALDLHFYTFNLKDLFSNNTNVSGTISLLGQLSIAPNDWILSFAGDFHKIFLDNFSMDSGMISGFIPLNKQGNLQFSVNAKKSSAYNSIIEDLDLNTTGSINQFSTTITMSGFAEQALKGNIAFSIVDLSAIEIEASTIQLGQHKILLSSPVRILYLDNKLTIDPSEINIDNGQLKINGDLSPEYISLKASLNQIPSQLLYNITHGKYFLKGLIDGTLHAYGQLNTPTIKLDIKTVDQLYTTKLLGTVHEGVLKTTIDLQSNQLNLKLDGAYPLNLSFSPLNFDLDHSKPYYTNLIAVGMIDNIQQIFDLNYDKLSGNIDANISLHGTIDRQTSKGYINIRNGTYERQNIGLKLNNINLNLTAKNGHFVLNEPIVFHDHHANSGTLVSANLGIGKFLIPCLTTEMTFKKINFIDLPQTRRGGMSAFCSGTLKANGPVNALGLYIRGEISSLEKYIGESEDIPIYRVNTTHKHLPVNLTPSSSNQSTSEATYDIDLALERKFHIFGQGLDSTWKGKLVIQGTSTTPIYKGQFVLQEGQLRILDRFFDVQRGEIFFDGDLSPTLYIESDLKLQDMRVKIILEGDSTNLQKKFISDRNLSEQEILQKLFFNRSSTVSQSFQALNYLAASSFISSFINIGFYQQEDPIRHTEKEFISIRQKFSKRTYGKVDFGINSDTETDKVSLAAGFQPTPQTKTELTFSPNKNYLGIGLEWSKDF